MEGVKALDDARPAVDAAGAAATAPPSEAEVGRRVELLSRRYYPLAIGAAFLAMVVGFFPSTSPLELGGLFSAPPLSPAPSAPAAPVSPTATATAGGSAPASFAPPSVSGSYPEPLAATTVPSFPASAPVGASPAPSQLPPSPASCPIPIPTTGTPLDDLLLEVESICQTLIGSQGTLPSVPALLGVPGVPATPVPPSSASTASSSSPTVASPPQWIAVDQDLATSRLSGGTGSSLTWGTDFESAAATVLVGLVQGSPVPAQLPAALSTLRKDGAVVDLVLVPDPTALGGAAAFRSWVTQTLVRLPGGPRGSGASSASLGPMLVAVAAAARPAMAPANVAAVVADDVSGLGAAEASVAPGEEVGLWWGDGGLQAGDAAVWTGVKAAAAHSTVLSHLGYVGATLTGQSACEGIAALQGAVSTLMTGGAVPLLVEGVPVAASAGASAAGSASCLQDALAQTGPRWPSAMVSAWRQGAGPAR